MKTKIFSIFLTLLLFSSVYLLPSLAQDYTQWHLPEGAKARIGKGGVSELTYSPDGSQLAVGTELGIWIYDTHAGTEIDWLTPDPSNPTYVTSVTYSPDGRSLAAGGSHRVYLWDAVAGQSEDILKVPAINGWVSGVNGVKYSPDGRTLASGGYADNTVRLWDPVTGASLGILRGHTNQIHSIAFSPDGKILASASGRKFGDEDVDNTVRLWDTVSGVEKAVLSGHAEYVSSVSFSPDGKTLASGSRDATIRLWDVGTGQLYSTLKDESGVLSVSFSPDGRTLASGNMRGGVQLWDIGTGQLKSTLREHTSNVVSVAFSPDGRTVASGSLDGTIRLSDTITGQLISTLRGHTREVKKVAFSRDGVTLVIQDSKDVQLWSTVTGQLKFTLPNNGWIYDIDYSPDGRTLAIAGAVDVQLWRADTGQHKATFIELEREQYILSLAYSPDGTTIATGSVNGKTYLWDALSGAPKATLSGDVERVYSIGFSPDSAILAGGGGRAETVHLWDTSSGALLKTFAEHPEGVMNIAFSPDGNTLAVETPGAGYFDAKVVLWDVTSGQRKASLPIARSCYYSGVAFSPDGGLVASGGNGGPLLMWDVATGELLNRFTGHRGWIQTIAFSPDGDTLASGSIDGTVFLWDVTPFVSQQQTQQDTYIKQTERELVQLIYFRPTDRLSQLGIDAALDKLMRNTQYFYTARMQSHGGKTFAFETDIIGNAKVHHVNGKFNDAYYHEDTYDRVLEEVAEQFDISKNIYLIAVDVSTEVINDAHTCGIGGGGWSSRDNETWRRSFGGTAMIPASGVCFTEHIAAHELGHAFGLEHDFRDDAYLMAYGTQKRLSEGAAEWLAAHRFFNPRQTFFNETTTIGMISSFASEENTRRLRFELTDPEGLHQVQLLIPTAPADPAQGTKLHSYRSLNGTGQAVEFVVTGLGDDPDTEVTLQVIDGSGNITKQTFPFVLEGGLANRSPVAVGTIPSQTVTIGGDPKTLDISSYFSDPDEDILSYNIESSNEHVATVSVTGTILTIVPSAIGTANIALTASDGKLSVIHHFSVHITSPPVEETPEVRAIIATVRTEDLVLYLPFDAGTGTTAADSSKHQNHGTLHKATWTDGKDGNGVELTGEPGSWVEVPDSPSLDITDKITLMAWVHPTRFTHEWLRIIVKTWAGDIAPWMVYGLYQQGDSNGKVGFIMSVDGGREVRCGNGPSPQLPLNEWTHLAATYDGTRMKLYYNGELKVEAAATGQIDTNDVPLSIGRNSEGNRERYIGLIDEVAIWSAALTESEIRQAMGDTSGQAAPTLSASVEVLPTQTGLLPNYPNPFNPETWLPYQLADPADVTLHIYSINGTLVRTLSLGHQAAGMYHGRSRAAYWDGRNAQSEPVASGIYFYTLTAGDFTATRKMLIRK